MLWPSGVMSVQDLPNDLANAIEHAVTVIGWEQVYDRDEMPPEWMWPFPSDLKLWFEDVQQARKEKWGTGSTADDDDGLVDNALAPKRRRR